MHATIQPIEVQATLAYIHVGWSKDGLTAHISVRVDSKSFVDLLLIRMNVSVRSIQ